MLEIFITIRNFVYKVVGFIAKIFPHKRNHVVVFCYHSISNDGWRFSVKAEDFKEQINETEKTHTHASLAEIEEIINGKKVIDRNYYHITFDDGYSDILSIKDFLFEKGIKPTVFLISDRNGINRIELETNLGVLSRNEVIDLISNGWTIGSHTKTHSAMSELDEISLPKEIIDSKKDLEKEYNIPVNAIAYPKGVYTESILKKVKEAKYEMGFSVDEGYVSSKTNRFIIPRVGVDGTHSIENFKLIYTPQAMYIRRFVKNIFNFFSRIKYYFK